jgi:ER-bound oxygenase mpaB/B'/Rubber oxygenase, catalytic domain
MTADNRRSQYPRRVRLSDARRRFGDRADVAAAAVSDGDPIADAAITAMRNAGLSQATVNRLLRGDLPSDHLPQALNEFDEHLHAVPSWVDWERVDRGSKAVLAVGFIWMQLLLGPASLVNTYRPPGLARVLTSTERLVKVAPRRIQETGAWLTAATHPGHLRVGEPGWIATAQVRLLHARVRAQLLNDGWEVDEWGVPINQADLARTLLDFTVTPMVALERLGVGFTTQERDDVHHLFHLIAHLIGVDPSLHVDTDTEARSLAELLEVLNGPPDADARALVDAMIEAYVELLTPAIHVTRPMTRQLVRALIEVFHDGQTYEDLRLPRPRLWARAAVRGLGLANSAARLTHRMLPVTEDWAVRRTQNSLAAASSLLVGSTAYQNPQPSAADRLRR